MLYFYTEVDKDHLGDVVNGLRYMNFAGFAVTKPNKVRVLRYLDELDPLCKKMGASNTVVKTPEGKLIGYNTDGVGFYTSLVVYRSISLKDLIPFLASSVKTYGGLAFVLAFATAFGRVLSLTRATKVIEEFIVGNFTTSWSVLSVLVILFLILGMVMDTGPAIVILAPILLPAVQALGVDSVHFGVILVCCLSIGLATPPFGLDLFVAGNLAEEPPMAVAKRAVPFIISFLLALALITYVEPVSLALLGR